MKSKSSYLTFLLFVSLVFFLLNAAILPAQEKAAQGKPLPLQKMVFDSLAPKTPHVYTLSLKPDMFIHGRVDQITVDVVVAIKDPQGEEIKSIDGPGRGPEFFQFDSKEAGEYQIEVKPFEEESGQYAIELQFMEPIAEDPEKRVDQLMAAFTSKDIPGAAIAVFRKGRVKFAKAYGMANLTYSIPFTVETLNNIGSTSKQFTAFAIAFLAEDGKLSLDDDVRKHVPELPDFGNTVTIRHLTSHTSGYREFLNTAVLDGRSLAEGDYIRREEIIEMVQRQPELQNDPGAEWNYNNTAFSLLATIVERVTEVKFPEWMEKNVFKPQWKSILN